jgi:hypothetical protein
VVKEANVKVSQQKRYADGLGEKSTDADTYQKMLIALKRLLRVWKGKIGVFSK